jgi:hypothetical protein
VMGVLVAIGARCEGDAEVSKPAGRRAFGEEPASRALLAGVAFRAVEVGMCAAQRKTREIVAKVLAREFDEIRVMIAVTLRAFAREASAVDADRVAPPAADVVVASDALRIVDAPSRRVARITLPGLGEAAVRLRQGSRFHELGGFRQRFVERRQSLAFAPRELSERSAADEDTDREERGAELLHTSISIVCGAGSRDVAVRGD